MTVKGFLGYEEAVDSAMIGIDFNLETVGDPMWKLRQRVPANCYSSAIFLVRSFVNSNIACGLSDRGIMVPLGRLIWPDDSV
ncbi:hypothetical protein FD09_GL001146 [Schleiferilactobacillus perolens DSM 12744]|uniref:Uncharacterized protein n=1 Tax=Schleiferilactobacillus perolens DSM 12744 TaxID=1423792 RepID=A0A0R1MLM0_9LACO|nr:hypothetical protein FD09_GL001146 [Schleiferilactobacillus perolens DSM 12744]